jgi:molybdopterin converting factor small subunit
MSHLAENHDAWAAQLLSVPGCEAHPEVVLFVDGELVDLETPLASGAVLNVMPPIAGG